MPLPTSVRKLLMYLTKREMRGLARRAAEKPVKKLIAEPALGEGESVLQKLLRPTKPSGVGPEFEYVGRSGYKAKTAPGFGPEELSMFKELRLPKMPAGMSQEQYGKALIKRAQTLRSFASRLSVSKKTHKTLARRLEKAAIRYEALGKADIAKGPLPGSVEAPKPQAVPEGFPVKRPTSLEDRYYKQQQLKRLYETAHELPTRPLAEGELESVERELGKLFTETRQMRRKFPTFSKTMKAAKQEPGTRDPSRNLAKFFAVAKGTRSPEEIAPSSRFFREFAAKEGISEQQREAARRTAFDLKSLGGDPRPVEEIQAELLRGGFERSAFGQRALGSIREARTKAGLQPGQPLEEEAMKAAFRPLYPKRLQGGRQRKQTRDIWTQLIQKLSEGRAQRVGRESTIERILSEIRNRETLPDIL